MSHNRAIGRIGETEAINYLHSKGYHVVEQNFYTHWGEIDIIAKKDKKLSFIEVKTRTGQNKGKPFDSVTSSKIKHLFRPIRLYLLQNNYKDYKLSLDVISIVLKEDLSVDKINHYENIYGY